MEPEALAGLPQVVRPGQDVEEQVRPYVRAPKRHYRRLRPAEIEPAIQPVHRRLGADQSYPSGHRPSGWTMGLSTGRHVARAPYAAAGALGGIRRQRMVCGVHFPSDLEAGRQGAAWLMERMGRSPDFVAARARRRARTAHRAGSAIRPLEREPRAPRLALAPAVTRPRCSIATRATMASPSPKPPVSRLRLVSSRVNAWNTAPALRLRDTLAVDPRRPACTCPARAPPRW
jgi:hypothetical protein